GESGQAGVHSADDLAALLDRVQCLAGVRRHGAEPQRRYEARNQGLPCFVEHQMYLLLNRPGRGLLPWPPHGWQRGNVALEKTMQQTYQRRSATKGRTTLQFCLRGFPEAGARCDAGAPSGAPVAPGAGGLEGESSSRGAAPSAPPMVVAERCYFAAT